MLDIYLAIYLAIGIGLMFYLLYTSKIPITRVNWIDVFLFLTFWPLWLLFRLLGHP